MSNKKKPQQTRFCRIFQWVEAQDPDFASAISVLCLDRFLIPGGPVRGVTFLFPKEKAFRDEIVAKAHSDEADEASKMIESLILPDRFGSSADFKQRDVGNRLGVKLVVESADASRVKIAGGVELVPADDFRMLANRADSERVAVWILAKGRPPTSGESYAAPSRERVERKRGGAAGKRGGGSGERCRLASSVEAEHDAAQGRDGTNAFLGKLVSLLNFLKARDPATLAKITPLLDYDPIVSFYIVVEPYKTNGEYLIPDSLLFGDQGWNGIDAYGSAVPEYEAYFALAGTGAKGAGGDAAITRDRAGVAARIDAIRQQLGSRNPRDLAQAVQDTYATLTSRNEIGGMGNILPQSTVQALPGLKKLWQDEFRFYVGAALRSVGSGARYDGGAFASVVRDIRACWCGNNYQSELRLANVADLKANVSGRIEMLLLLKFINSTDFLYAAVAPDAVGSSWGSPTDPTDTAVYNRNADALAALRRIGGMSRPSGISPAALAELQIYVKTHGSLPPDVAALGGR